MAAEGLSWQEELAVGWYNLWNPQDPGMGRFETGKQKYLDKIKGHLAKQSLGSDQDWRKVAEQRGLSEDDLEKMAYDEFMRNQFMEMKHKRGKGDDPRVSEVASMQTELKPMTQGMQGAQTTVRPPVKGDGFAGLGLPEDETIPQLGQGGGVASRSESGALSSYGEGLSEAQKKKDRERIRRFIGV